MASMLELKARLRLLPKADRRSLLLDAGDLAAGYYEQRARAPRRAQGYLSLSRSGVTSSGDISTRAEEHLAVGLFLRRELALPNGERLTLLDYQFPLKSIQADNGIGKIDLLGQFEDGTLAVIELKVAKNQEDRRIALLEGLIYAAIVEANIEPIAAEFLLKRGIRIARTRPRVLLIAPDGYWADHRIFPSTEQFEALANEVARARSRWNSRRSA
jgi:hypothetical protein